MGRREFRIPRVLSAAGLLLALHAGLLADTAARKSPTVDEPGHLVGGLFSWRFGRFEVYRANPPLVRLIAALPVMAIGCETDWSRFSSNPGGRPEFALGEDFVRANRENSLHLLTLARWSCIPFSLLGACLCFQWARELFHNDLAGLISLACWVLDPMILGHGALITPDVPAASLSLAASYSFWKWLAHPSWKRALLSSAVLGIALLTKSTLLLLCPVFLCAWAIAAIPRQRLVNLGWRCRSVGTRPAVGQLVIIFFGALYVVNSAYLFTGTFTPLRNYLFTSDALTAGTRVNGLGNRFRSSIIGHLRIPLPEDYVQGLDIQKRDFEQYDAPSYLAGSWRNSGLWYYCLYAWLVKTPHATQLLTLSAMLIPLFLLTSIAPSRRHGVDAPHDSHEGRCGIGLAIAVTAALLAANLIPTSFSHHYRYALPALGHLHLFTGSVAILLQSRRVRLAFCVGSIAALFPPVLAHHPHHLSYFNELSGGAANGDRHLLHSSIDWGQDLIELRLAQQSERFRDRPMFFAYYGRLEPSYLGIKYRCPPHDVLERPHRYPRALLAVSVTYLRGWPKSSYDGTGGRTCRALDYPSLLAVPEAGRCGESIRLYELDSVANLLAPPRLAD